MNRLSAHETAEVELAMVAFGSGILRAAVHLPMKCPDYLAAHRLSFERGYAAANNRLFPTTHQVRETFTVVNGGKS